MKKNTPLWQEVRNTILRALWKSVARSIFASQNAEKMTVSDHFLKFGSARVARSTFPSQNVKT